MRLPDFQLHQPESATEAVKLAADFRGNFDFMAGGTDLLPNYKFGLNTKPHVISLNHIPELKKIAAAADDDVLIGAAVTLRELAEHPLFKKRFPGLAQAALTVASPLIRQQATVGGNVLLDTRCVNFNQSAFQRLALGSCLKAEGDVCRVVPQKEKCYATYCGDLAPVLMALNARLEFRSIKGKRSVAVRDFFVSEGVARFSKKPGELLAAIVIPAASKALKVTYKKLRLREAIDFPELGVAGALKMTRGKIQHLDLCFTGIASAPLSLWSVTQLYHGREMTEQLIEAIALAAPKIAKPIKNTNFAPSYRRQMMTVYTRRVLQELAGLS